MSGRIALMVRGLPSIGIDEAVERFGKYYAKPSTATFHESPSFIGTINDNSVSFINRETKEYYGGQGLTLESRKDLRRLGEDFERYAQENPGIYTNDPNTESKARLYRRVGFQDTANGSQVLDTRRIAKDEIPYIQAIDSLVMPKDISQALYPTSRPLFLSSDGVVISGSRIRPEILGAALRQQPNDLSGDVNWAIYKKQQATQTRSSLAQARKSTDTSNILDPVKFVAAQPKPSIINEDLESGAFRSMARRPERLNEVQRWASLAGLGQVTERNARTISRLHRDYQSALYRLQG